MPRKKRVWYSETMPRGYHLPKRNRLIAALSDKIYVMETCRKSGTESTVENGIKYVREIIRGK